MGSFRTMFALLAQYLQAPTSFSMLDELKVADCCGGDATGSKVHNGHAQAQALRHGLHLPRVDLAERGRVNRELFWRERSRGRGERESSEAQSGPSFCYCGSASH